MIAACEAARPRVAAVDKRIMALLPKGKRDGFLDLLAELAGEADAGGLHAKAGEILSLLETNT